MNVIARKEWDKLASDEDAFIYDIRTKVRRNITAYGGKPLTVYGTFSAYVEVDNADKPRQFEEFFIVEDAGIALLSFSTAKRLKVLKVGTAVNTTEAPREFPKIPNLKVKFLIDNSVRPVKNSAFRIPASLEDEVGKQLDELEQQGIIEQARFNSPWMSRMDVVVKDRTKWRIVLDMREVNKAITRELHPFPTMEKFVAKLSGAKIFTKLDLKSAFHHIELDESSRDLTTFMTPKGPRRFTRLLFGVNCAPEIFQKTMEGILHGCEGVIIYIDDILIFAKSKEELQQREKTVVTKLRKHNLTINESKCQYGLETVEFLGCKLSKEGIAPADEKVKAIKNFTKPRD